MRVLVSLKLNAPFQVHISKVVSDAHTDADIPSMQREIFYRKTHMRNAYPRTLH
jgi:hypothetical protein